MTLYYINVKLKVKTAIVLNFDFCVLTFKFSAYEPRHPLHPPQRREKIYQDLSKDFRDEPPIWAGMLASHCLKHGFGAEI